MRAEQGKKAMIVFGQDEAIYNQNTTNTMQWVGPGGEWPLIPKNNGMGKMISAIQSRDTGWGVKLSRQQLVEINKQQEDKNYFNFANKMIYCYYEIVENNSILLKANI